MDHGATCRLSMANSPASKRKKSAVAQDSYHHIASTFFSLGKGNTTDLMFLEAARDGDFEKIEELLQRRNESLISVDVRDTETGNTPIIWAAKRGHIKIVQILLKNGADITLRNYEGQTGVEVASPQVQKLLLDSVDKGGPHRNLLQASWQGCARLVRKILTETRVDINCKNADGLTPLLLVTRDLQLFERLGDRVTRGYDPVEVLELLLNYRADPNMDDEEGKTALHYASSSKAQLADQLVEMLLTDGSDMDARDRRSFTPIHCASQSGNVDVVLSLLDGGSDANARGYAGTTPLHISAINGHDEVASTLLENGADVTLVDDSGLTAVDVAKTKRVKITLKQAWTEATHGRSEKILNPLRKSAELKIKTPKKKGGQVIFDIPELPTSAYTPRVLIKEPHVMEAPVTVSLINLSLAASSCSSVEPLTPRQAALERQITSLEKARRVEELIMYRDINANCGNAPSTSQVRGKTPRTGHHNIKRLVPIRSPRKNSTGGVQKEIRFCPSSKAHDGRCDRSVSASKHQTLKKCYSDPSRYQDGPCHQIPVTILGLDLDENLQDVRLKRTTHGPAGHVLHRKGHSRHLSDSSSLEYDDIYLKGRSASKMSMVSLNEEEPEDDCFTGSASRHSRTPSASNRLRIPETISEAHSAGRKPNNLDLDRMHVTNRTQTPMAADMYSYPNSNLLLPVTPQPHQDRGDSDYSSDYRMQESQEPILSSQENSPRSDEETAEDDPTYFDYHKQVKKAIDNVKELSKNKCSLMAGNFDIRKSRVTKSKDQEMSDDVRSSNDSGCSVESTSSKLVPKSKETESHKKKLKTNSDSKKKIVCNKNENNGPKNVRVVGKTVANVQSADKKPSDNTYVTVVTAPKADTEVKTAPAVVVPSSCQTENDVSTRKTYQTVCNAPAAETKVESKTDRDQKCSNVASSADKLSQDVQKYSNKETTAGKQSITVEIPKQGNNTTPVQKCSTAQNKPVESGTKVNIQKANTSKTSNNSAPQSKVHPTPRKAPQNSCQKAAPPPRPIAPPRQKSNVAKAKFCPVKKEHSTLGNKGSQNVNFNPRNSASNITKQQSKAKNAKPVVPPRPQSVLSVNTKQQVSQEPIATYNQPSKPADTQTADRPTKPTTASKEGNVNVKKPDAVVVSKATETKVVESQAKPTTVPATKGNSSLRTHGAVLEDTKNNLPTEDVSAQKDTPPQVPARPRSVKAKLIRVASSETEPKDLGATFTVQKDEPTKPICKITINGKDSTIPSYNPKVVKVTPVLVKDAKESDNKLMCSTNATKADTANTKVETENTNVFTASNDKEVSNEVNFVPRPVASEHEGPVIWDPFENIREQNQKSTDQLEPKEEESKPRAKSAKCSNNRLYVPGARKFSGKKRSDSATKRNAKVKAIVDTNKNVRPKSPKKKGGKKKKKVGNVGKEMGDKGNSENVGYVSGIGWHLDYDEAPTFTKVHPFSRFKPAGDYSSEEEEDNPNSPRVLTDHASGAKLSTPRSLREVDSFLPNVAMSLEELEDYTTGDDSDCADAEDVLNVAEFKHHRDSIKSKDEKDNTPPKTNVVGLSGGHKVSNLPHVAQATKVSVKPANVAQKPSNTNNSGSIAKQQTMKKSVGTIQPNSQQNGKKPVSNPISPGAAVSERRPSFSKASLTGSSNSVRIEKTPAKPRREPIAQSVESNDLNVNKTPEKEQLPDNKVDSKEKRNGKERPETNAKKTDVRNSHEDLENMIDEIMKTTPNPTLSFKSNEKTNSSGKKQKGKKQSREQFEKQLRASHEGKAFRQIQNSPGGYDDGGSDGTSWKSSSTASSDTSDAQNPHEEFEINSDEKYELEKLMKSLKNMELMVSLPQEDSSPSGIKTPAKNRPPAHPKSRPSANTSKTENRHNEEVAYLPDRSPRFVRKRDSMRDSARKEVIFRAVDFDSCTLDYNDDSLFPDNSRVVTSRMGGRRSAAGSRCSSGLNDSMRDENTFIETIQWKRGNQLGKGAFGTVWCGLTNSGELIAVKQIELNTADMDMAEDEYEKIHEEVDLLKTLNHKNIVGYLGTSLEDHIVSIFMEFVPGGSIGSILARFGALEEEVFCLYTKQILEGVEYLHANSVIHRDIKGGNIMLMPTGVIKLIDFGCAKRLCLNVNAGNSSHGSSRLLKSMRGTPYWMAPEVVKETGYGTKSDIWSIGCTVFEMATRKPPWAEVPPMAAIFAIGSDKPIPQLPDKFSHDALSFVNACLTRCQSTRPNATQLLKHPFILKKNVKKR